MSILMSLKPAPVRNPAPSVRRPSQSDPAPSEVWLIIFRGVVAPEKSIRYPWVVSAARALMQTETPRGSKLLQPTGHPRQC